MRADVDASLAALLTGCVYQSVLVSCRALDPYTSDLSCVGSRRISAAKDTFYCDPDRGRAAGTGEDFRIQNIWISELHHHHLHSGGEQQHLSVRDAVFLTVLWTEQHNSLHPKRSVLTDTDPHACDFGVRALFTITASQQFHDSR